MDPNKTPEQAALYIKIDKEITELLKTKHNEIATLSDKYLKTNTENIINQIKALTNDRDMIFEISNIILFSTVGNAIDEIVTKHFDKPSEYFYDNYDEYCVAIYENLDNQVLDLIYDAMLGNNPELNHKILMTIYQMNR